MDNGATQTSSNADDRAVERGPAEGTPRYWLRKRKEQHSSERQPRGKRARKSDPMKCSDPMLLPDVVDTILEFLDGDTLLTSRLSKDTMFHGKRLNPAVVDLVIVALATVGWGPVSQATATPQPLVFQKLPVSDVLFGEDMLGQKPARSRVDCGRMCAQDARCLVFTFQPGTQGTPGSCLSHSTRRAAQVQQGAATGARSYSLRKEDWIQKNCSTTSDCREPMAACFSGQCLCDKGFFFDHTENACVSTCTRGLGDKYLAYKDWDISGHDIKSFYDTDNMTACKSACSALPDCLTLVDWRNECHLKKATAQDAPRDWRTVKLCTLYQKTCR